MFSVRYHRHQQKNVSQRLSNHKQITTKKKKSGMFSTFRQKHKKVSFLVPRVRLDHSAPPSYFSKDVSHRHLPVPVCKQSYQEIFPMYCTCVWEQRTKRLCLTLPLPSSLSPTQPQRDPCTKERERETGEWCSEQRASAIHTTDSKPLSRNYEHLAVREPSGSAANHFNPIMRPLCQTAIH